LTPALVEAKVMDRTANFIGLELKVNKVTRGSRLSFLSRVFVDIWTTASSFQDPMRTLAKINSTVSTKMDILEAGFEKATAYLVTDGRTPVISDWCNCYLRIVQRMGLTYEIDFESQDVPYWVRNCEFIKEPWPQDSYDSMVSHVEEILGTEVGQFVADLNLYNGNPMGMPQLQLPPAKIKVAAQVVGVEGDAVRQNSDLEDGSVVGSSEDGSQRSTADDAQCVVGGVGSTEQRTSPGRDTQRRPDNDQVTANSRSRGHPTSKPRFNSGSIRKFSSSNRRGGRSGQSNNRGNSGNPRQRSGNGN
jgi:hypothetical protein